MKALVTLLSVLLLAALAGFVVMYLQHGKQSEQLDQSASLLEKKTAEETLAKQKLAQAQAAEKAAQAARKFAEEQAAKAAEAERMAKAALAQEEDERQKRLAELNQRLAKEAAAREAAERAATEAAKKMEQLQQKITETEERQKAIIARQQAETEAEKARQAAIAEEISRNKQALASVAQNHDAAQRDRARRIDQQIRLEEEIAKQGGSITIPNYRVWSPNYRPVSRGLKSSGSN